MPVKKKINMIKSQKQKQNVNIKINIGDKAKKSRRTYKRKTTPSEKQSQRSINPISVAVNASAPPTNYINPYNDMLRQQEKLANTQEKIFKLYQNVGLQPSRQVSGLSSPNVGPETALNNMTRPPDLDTNLVDEITTPNPLNNINRSLSQRLPVGKIDIEDMNEPEPAQHLAHEVADNNLVKSKPENKNVLSELIGKVRLKETKPVLKPVADNELTKQEEIKAPPRMSLLDELKKKQKERENKEPVTEIERPPIADDSSQFKKELQQAIGGELDPEAVMIRFKKFYKDGNPSDLRKDLQRLERIAGSNKDMETKIENKDDIASLNKIFLATGFITRPNPTIKYKTVINRLQKENFKKKLKIILGEDEPKEEYLPVGGFPEEKPGSNIVTLSDIAYNR